MIYVSVLIFLNSKNKINFDFIGNDYIWKRGNVSQKRELDNNDFPKMPFDSILKWSQEMTLALMLQNFLLLLIFSIISTKNWDVTLGLVLY